MCNVQCAMVSRLSSVAMNIYGHIAYRERHKHIHFVTLYCFFVFWIFAKKPLIHRAESEVQRERGICKEKEILTKKHLWNDSCVSNWNVFTVFRVKWKSIHTKRTHTHMKLWSIHFLWERSFSHEKKTHTPHVQVHCAWKVHLCAMFVVRNISILPFRCTSLKHVWCI